jgi:hypothetical protein
MESIKEKSILIASGQLSDLSQNLGLQKKGLSKDEYSIQIEKDIKRTPFVSGNYVDFKLQWEKNHDPQYSQGNMTGAVFSDLLKQQVIIQDEDLENCLLNSKKVEFGFINDKGQLCGFCLSYVKSRQDLWCLTIVINTASVNPDDKLVKIIVPSSMPQKLHGNFQDKFNDLNQSVIDVCKESLCSEMTNKLLNKIFDEKNNINFEWANILNESLRGEDSNKELCNQLTTKNPPESLSIKDIVVSHLNILVTNGFNKISLHFYTIPGDNPLHYYRYWIAENSQGKKIVLFEPGKDVPQMQETPLAGKLANILEIQKIARKYVDDGHTCVIPVTEHGETVVGNASVNRALNFFSSYLSQLPVETDTPFARKHWVSLLWNRETLKFFDPKSSNALGLGLVKYDNQIFKDFAKIAGYEIESKSLFGGYEKSDKGYYTSCKEQHPQSWKDFNNCGYYIMWRFNHAVECLRTNDSLNIPAADFPDQPIKMHLKGFANITRGEQEFGGFFGLIEFVIQEYISEQEKSGNHITTIASEDLKKFQQIIQERYNTLVKESELSEDHICTLEI